MKRSIGRSALRASAREMARFSLEPHWCWARRPVFLGVRRDQSGARMNYHDMNRLAGALCGVIAFVIILMIGLSGVDTTSAENGFGVYFQ